jgi:hypothetical protein
MNNKIQEIENEKRQVRLVVFVTLTLTAATLLFILLC